MFDMLFLALFKMAMPCVAQRSQPIIGRLLLSLDILSFPRFVHLI